MEDKKNLQEGLESSEEQVILEEEPLIDRAYAISTRQKVLIGVAVVIGMALLYWFFIEPVIQEENETDMDEIKAVDENYLEEVSRPTQHSVQDEESLPEIREKVSFALELPPAPVLPELDTGQLIIPQRKRVDEVPPAVEGTISEEAPIAIQDLGSIDPVSMSSSRVSRSAPMVAFGGRGSQAEEDQNEKKAKAEGPYNDGKEIKLSDHAIEATHMGDLRYVVAEGKIIDAVLETGINTDLKGVTRAIVSRDVYSEAGTNVLIPKGTRLVGTYNTTPSITQARVEIQWNRMILPSGLDFDLGESYSSDTLGRAGVKAHIDTKLFNVLGLAALTSAIEISTGLLVDRLLGDSKIRVDFDDDDNTTKTTGTAGAQVIQRSIAEFSNIMSQHLKLYQDDKPSALVDPGIAMKVYVRDDLYFPDFPYSKYKSNKHQRGVRVA